MAPKSSDGGMSAVFARLIKSLMVAVLLPLPVGMLTGMLERLELISLSGGTYREWVTWGFMTYVGFHVLIYQPAPVFQASHRVFATVAAWLFGGQVASVDDGGGRGKGGKGPKGAAGQGSTLVAFSPYVIPVYTVLTCLLGWAAGQWADRKFTDGPLSFLIGVTMAFHWLMTANDLQQQRARWHIETYLLAIGLVFLLTLLLGGMCLPWAFPEFSFVRAIGDGLGHTQSIYRAVALELFFR
jgi:hypothetical protein